MVKIKKYTWKRVSFSLRKEISDAIDSVPRNKIPNKSNLVESLLIEWLQKNNFIKSGSL